VIEGHVTIGKDCVIESSYIRDSQIGDRVTVGPFAHIRHQSILQNDVRIGNFVEVKKSTLDDGVKAAHLTYLGDSVIGKHVNIGCGTITVNYDGTLKHQTIIEANAFIGSNVNLIAPIKIGAGAKGRRRQYCDGGCASRFFGHRQRTTNHKGRLLCKT
jgi:bifunctional UDP-N-acetylglucosamine pyrophosphorylase / glucosamine-1-phosphate N-acetyltransferase